MKLPTLSIKHKKALKHCFKYSVYALPSILMFLTVEEIPNIFDKDYIQCMAISECVLPFPVYKGVLALFIMPLFIFIIFYEFLSHIKQLESLNITTLNNILWHTELKAFVDNLNLSSTERVTLYIHHQGGFFNAGRESKNPSFKHKGRSFYKNGLIERAFNNGSEWEIAVNDPQKSLNDYISEVSEKANITKTEAKRLAMKSKRLYARKVCKLNGDPVGVLLIETEKEDFKHILFQCGNVLDDKRLERIFERECRRLSHYLNSFQIPQDLFKFEEEAI